MKRQQSKAFRQQREASKHRHNGRCGDLHKFEGEQWADDALERITCPCHQSQAEHDAWFVSTDEEQPESTKGLS